MFKRALWLGVGIAVGVIVVRKIAQTADSMSPSGIAARLKENAVTAKDSIRSFMDDVSDGMHEKEAELRAAVAEGMPIDELLAEDDEQINDSGMGGTS